MTWLPLSNPLLRVWHWFTGHPLEDRSSPNYQTGAVWCRCGAQLGPKDSQ